MNEQVLPYLKDWLYQLADDKLTMGHRDSEWLGLCPDIEGDVAFSSIAQDEIGHAVFYFELLHELGEDDPDTLAFTRQSFCRRNAILLERPNQDWIYSIVRHLFYDVFDHFRLRAMTESSFASLRHGTQKILNEEKYHILHLTSWFTRLGHAGEKVKMRLQEAVSMVWTDLGGLFCCGLYEIQLIDEGILSYGSEEMKARWISHMKLLFTEAEVVWPGEIPLPPLDGRLGEHSEDLISLLSALTEVYQLDPTTRW